MDLDGDDSTRFDQGLSRLLDPKARADHSRRRRSDEPGINDERAGA
jgi:hypothetical protein